MSAIGGKADMPRMSTAASPNEFFRILKFISAVIQNFRGHHVVTRGKARQPVDNLVCRKRLPVKNLSGGAEGI
jgi:hypothetical protein